jgi:hypothetical protein
MNAPARRHSLRIAAKSATVATTAVTTRSFGKQQQRSSGAITTNTIRRSSRLAALPRISYAGMDGDAEDSI